MVYSHRLEEDPESRCVRKRVSPRLSQIYVKVWASPRGAPSAYPRVIFSLWHFHVWVFVITELVG